MIDLKRVYRFSRNYYRDYNASRNNEVKVFNSIWTSKHDPCNWLRSFILERGLLKNCTSKTISLFSVNGERFVIDFNNSDFKIFYTGENVHVLESPWEKYNDLMLNKKSVNLSIGFDYIDHEKYLRFPLWLMYMFKPNDNIQNIKQKCQKINQHHISVDERIKFCSFICKNDYFGDRIKMYNQISKIGHIDCDSLFMHNNDDLKLKYNDNKLDYLTQYRFNLCPENSNNEGYVTEKIFEAIYSGCIPIYWGSNNNPEPTILNRDAIFFIDNTNESPNVIEEIIKINSDIRLYKEFAEQDRLLIDAPEIIYNYFETLEKKLTEILNL